MKKLRKLSEELRLKVEAEVKMMLHASRDCLRTRWNFYQTQPDLASQNLGKIHDPAKTAFVSSDGYYGEAFGIMRAMILQGYGRFGAINTPFAESGSVSEWFYRLSQEVLKEENFGQDNPVCGVCLARYGRG